MFYKRKNTKDTEGTFFDLTRKLRMSDVDEFQKRLMEVTGRKSLQTFFYCKPEDLKIKEFFAVKKVFKEFGLSLELKVKI